MAELRQYGVATTILFPLIDRGAVDFESTPVTFATGDVQLIRDEAAAANSTNLPTHEGNGIYSLALTAAEAQAARIVATVIDQTNPKEWEDQAALIDTYGHPSAQHAFNLNAPVLPTRNQALSNIPFYMFDANGDPVTGQTLTVTRSLDAAAFAAVAGATAEIGNGVYQFDATAADMDGAIVVFRGVATGAKDVIVPFLTS